MATTNVNAPGFACGENPVVPPLMAKARAGADVTIQWTAVPIHHWGPSMTVGLTNESALLAWSSPLTFD